MKYQLIAGKGLSSLYKVQNTESMVWYEYREYSNKEKTSFYSTVFDCKDAALKKIRGL